MSTVTELLKNSESVGVWTLDSDQSTITFNNKTMWGAMKVNGVFTEFSGDGQITNSGTLFGRVDIKAASLNTKLRKRDDDLRSPTFLDVDNYPDISVVVTGVEPGPDETLKLRADLTVKGTTAPMPMRARVALRDDGAVDLPGVPAHRMIAAASAPGPRQIRRARPPRRQCPPAPRTRSISRPAR